MVVRTIRLVGPDVPDTSLMVGDVDRDDDLVANLQNDVIGLRLAVR